MSKGKAIRYSAAKKREVIKFVNDFNQKNGRGGQAAASKKFKVGSLSIAKWLKKEGSPAKTKAKKPAATSGSLKSVLARMTEIRDQMEKLSAEMNELYSSATQLAPREKSSSIGNILSGKSKPWNSLKKEQPVFTISPEMAKEREWTNQDGKTILATLMSVKDEVAVLKVKGGTVYRYPVAALSKKNQEEIAALAS
jgi:hypothetical protein